MQSSGIPLLLLEHSTLLALHALCLGLLWKGSRFAPQGIIIRMESCQSPIWLLCVVAELLGGAPVCGGQHLGG